MENKLEKEKVKIKSKKKLQAFDYGFIIFLITHIISLCLHEFEYNRIALTLLIFGSLAFIFAIIYHRLK